MQTELSSIVLPNPSDNIAVARATIEPGDAIHDGTQSIVLQVNREAQPNVLSIV